MQLVSLLLLSAGIALFNRDIAIALLFGGLIQIGPSAYFTWQAYRYRGARFARHTLAAMYRGESAKLLLTAVLFGMTFHTYKDIDVAILFLGYILMYVLHAIFSCKILASKKSQTSQ